MARLPNDRDTHLTPDEIVAEALRQFDEGKAEPSTRSLAAALRVTPSAIYHHFGSRTAIVDACVERVWLEAMTEMLAIEPKPLEAAPIDVLVAGGLGARRAWLRHAHLSPYLAASPDMSDFTRNVFLLMGNLFGRMGLEGESVGVGFHAYSTFMIGSVLFAAGRIAADERLARDGRGAKARAGHRAPADPDSDDPDRRALEEMMDVSLVDPDRDEQLFEDALRRLVEGIASSKPEPRAD
jgi:AcrR family transcriptional regulator